MKPLLLTKLSIAFLLFASASFSVAQSEKPSLTDDEKAQQIVQRAIKTVGGDRYLQIKTVIGRGFFTDYKDGVSQIPSKFVDYVSYPDKERTEFNGGGARLVQTNFRDGGWIYDGAALTLKDQNAQQLEDWLSGHSPVSRRVVALRIVDSHGVPMRTRLSLSSAPFR